MALEVDFSRLDAMDVLDIAVIVERDAHEHYEELADWVKGRTGEEVETFFRAMATREQRHHEQLKRKRHELFGDTAARHDESTPWEVEAPDWSQLKPDMDLRQALELSLTIETNAHDYYAGAMEYVSDPATLDLLEGLRRAEVEHQRLIQEQLDRLT